MNRTCWRWRRSLCCGIIPAMLALALPARALESADLLFHLSFEDGVQAEFARGGAQPVTLPEGLPQRLVEGAIGKGYLFAGKGSTIEYAVGEQGPRRCAESYGPRANFFPDSGTLTFWVKMLPNANNQTHWYFKTEPSLLQFTRNEYWQHGFSYAGGGSIAWDSEMVKSPWHFIAVTWRKDEVCAYLNGHLMNQNKLCGVATQAPQKFLIAAQAEVYRNFQKPGQEDDGIMDEFMLFRRPLTAEEIRSLFERAQITTRHAVAGLPGDGLSPTPPERVAGGHALVAPALAAPITVDGNMADWAGQPAHGCFTDQRVAVLDDDAGKVYIAHDNLNLYLGFACPGDEALKNDPTHVLYPTGQYLVSTTARDGNVAADDYVEFALRGKDGHVYRFAVNAQGALCDSRDDDPGWNAEVRFTSRSDFSDWTAELAVPLAALGFAAGDAVDFNVSRSWKLFKSSQNSLCQNAQCQPGWGTLTLGGFDKLTAGTGASASLESLGRPAKGEITARGTIAGPAGNYRVRLHGKGLGQEFTEEQSVTLAEAPVAYEVKKRLEKTGDLAVVVEVTDPAGTKILTRTVPFVFVPVSAVELAVYPGWGRLEVTVAPVDAKDVRATVALQQGTEQVALQEIPAFTNPEMKVQFDTQPLATGEYQVVTRLRRGDALVGEDAQAYTKKPLPEWYRCTVGVLERPPPPWADVKVRGSKVQLTLKDIYFQKSLFPAQIVANGEKLLAAPIRLRVRRDGQDKVIAAGKFKIVKRSPVRVEWTATATDGALTVKIDGWIAYDGFTWTEIAVAGGTVEHLALEIPFRPESATLQTVGGADYGYIGDKPWKCYATWGGYWIGNEKAALGYFWEHQRDWVWNNETLMLTPALPAPAATSGTPTAAPETVLSVPFIQKTTDLTKPRSFNFGWGIAPFKPVRPDRRIVQIYKGITYSWSVDYSLTTPNYPKSLLQIPRDEEWLKRTRADLATPDSPINCWYAFGASAWPGSPEYADWWREWRYTPAPFSVLPDPNSKWVGPACHNSSAMDLHLWLLDKYIKEYPQRGIYYDCMTTPSCDNEAHGCGYVADDGQRRGALQVLATRRYYERIYNLFKTINPKYGWVRHHLWGVDFSLWSFCDDNWIGESYCGPLAGDPNHNYFNLLDLPHARMLFNNKRWGTEVSFLTEMAVSASVVPDGSDAFYGKVITPAADGKPGEMVIPWWPNYEHVAGLAIVHDMWAAGGNDLELPWMWVQEIERMMRWDDKVQFVGYWELGDLLDVGGGVKDTIVCSVYYRPPRAGVPVVPEMRSPDPDRYRTFDVADDVKAQLRASGADQQGWLILAPMNNTDAEVVLTLKPNLKKLGFPSFTPSRVSDIYRAFDWSWHWPTGEKVNTPLRMKGVKDALVFTDGVVRTTIPQRSFRMLLLEAAP